MTGRSMTGRSMMGREASGEPTPILQRLLRFDTTNPPGEEGECIRYIRDLLAGAGLETVIVAEDPERPNLVARLRGRGDAPPLLLQGHVDVVTTADQRWSRDPFGGEIADGCVWGRGALDMKGGVAMMLAAVLRIAGEGSPLAGDVVLAILSDEETGGDLGARFLVESHPELFQGIEFALGEFGGIPTRIGDRKFYLVQVAEKQICWLRVAVKGDGGHASLPVNGGAMTRLGELLRALEEQPPVVMTPVAERMLADMAARVDPELAAALRQPIDHASTELVGERLGPQSALIDAAVRNTVNATMVRGGSKINVIPSEVTVDLDCRLLPGQTPRDLLRQLEPILPAGTECEVLRYDGSTAEPDLSLLPLLRETLRELDPEAVTVPFLLSGSSDARFFKTLGIQSYGFLPLDLPPEFEPWGLIHGSDERVPVASLDFGVNAIHRFLRKFSARYAAALTSEVG